MRKVFTLLLVLGISSLLSAQFTTPTINGSIGTNEYGTHTNGQNQQTNSGRTWFMTWDNTNLYLAVTGAGSGNRILVYIDHNPIVPINGGSNSNGTINGFSYSNTQILVPFRADCFFALESGYRQLNIANGSNGWGSSNTSFGSVSGDFTSVYEVSIPWSTITNGGSRPASFNWCGYVTDNNAGGNYFAQMPTENPGGVIGTSLSNPSFERYYTVSSTTDGSATKPFSRNSYVLNRTSDETSFGGISVYDFTLNSSGRTITRNSSSGNNWVIANNLVLNAGTINFNNTASTATIANKLAVESGNTITVNNLTLLSTSTGTASIGPVTVGASTMGTISGNTTVQQFIPGGNRRFRFLSHPFTSAQNINVLGNSISYTGGTGTGSGFSHTTATNNPSVFTWNTANANGNSPNDGGWTALTTANSGTPWSSVNAIRILVRGSFAEGLAGETYVPSAATVSMTGGLRTTSTSATLGTGGSGATARFNLLGNPFASPLNIEKVYSGDNSGRIGSTIYLRIPSTGSYSTVDLSLVGNADFTIPAYAGFFVVAQSTPTPDANFSFNVNRIATTASSGTNVFSSLSEKQQYIELQTLLNNEVYDNTIVKFSKNYKKHFDIKEDAAKPMNDIISTYTLSSDNIRISNNTTPFEDGYQIPLGIVQNNGKRSVQFKVSSYFIPENQTIVLVDKLNNTRTTLAKDVVYNFEIDNNDTKTVGDERFVLELNTSKLTGIAETIAAPTSFSAKINGSNIIGNNNVQVQIANPAKAATSIRLVNFLGQTVSSIQGSQAEQQTHTVATSQLQAGKYFVEVVCGDEKQVLQVIKN